MFTNTCSKMLVCRFIICPMNKMIYKQEYQVKKIAFALTAIILSILSFAVTVMINLLMIKAGPTSASQATELQLGADSCHLRLTSVRILLIPKVDLSDVFNQSDFCISVTSNNYYFSY